MEKINVLYVDDQLLNLKAFQSSFRRIFNVYIAKTPAEGLAILDNHEIEVILSDQRMPDETGVDFFESILTKYPNPIRILVTGYSDINVVIDAINKGQVYRYITKPWHELDLKLSIESAYQLYLLKEQNNKLNTKYNKVFNASSDPIILFDLKGRIIDYNKATIRLVKTNSNNNLDFRTFNSILGSKTDTRQIIYILEKYGKIKDYECKLIGKENTVKNCLITVNSIKDNHGNITSFQAIVKDITTRKNMQRLMLKINIEAQEKERERISRDLHDGIGQQLAAIRMRIDMIDCPITRENEALAKIKTLVADTITDLRRICYNTIPLVLFDNGLVNAIENLIKQTIPFNIEVNFNYAKKFPSLTKSLEVALFRIVQEFFANTIKHSKATKIEIDLKFNNENIELSLKDNGIGFTIDKLTLSKGNGLANINYRVESLNGEFSMESVLNKQTYFNIKIPASFS